MGIKMVDYVSKYWPQIRELAERLALLSDDYDYMSTWGACIYPAWDIESISTVFPYPHGMTVLDGESVVGYFGAIVSTRYTIDGTPYTYVNATNWMLEPAYRRYFFPILTEYLRYADVYSDFSASEAVMKSLHGIYKFQYVDQMGYRFYPIPYEFTPLLDIRFIPPEDIMDSVVQLEYADHYQYGVRGLHISDGSQEGYVLYHRRGYCVRILKSTNKNLLTNHAHEIFWNLQKDSFHRNRKEDVACEMFQAIKQNKPVLLECPGAFLQKEHIAHPFFFGVPKFYFSKNHKSLFHSRLGKEVSIDYLYSEISVQYESPDIAIRHLPINNEFQ